MEGATLGESEEGRKVRRSWSFIKDQRVERLLFSRRREVESWLEVGGEECEPGKVMEWRAVLCTSSEFGK